MRRIIQTLAILGCAAVAASGAPGMDTAKAMDGKALFEEKCAGCHVTKIPQNTATLVAPPAVGITMHVKMAHPKKEDFTAFVVDYVQAPSAEKALCEKETVKRFGIMPSQKGNVTPAQLRTIADYLYATFAKGGHLKMMHEQMKRRFESDQAKYPENEGISEKK